MILNSKVLLSIFICVQFGCSSMYTFWVVEQQSNTFFDYFVCNSMGSSTASSTSTYLFTFCYNFVIIHPNDLGHLFQRRDVKLQIDIKFNVLGLAKVLKKCQTHEKKVNYELWNNSTIFEGPVHNMRPASLWFWYYLHHPI